MDNELIKVGYCRDYLDTIKVPAQHYLPIRKSQQLRVEKYLQASNEMRTSHAKRVAGRSYLCSNVFAMRFMLLILVGSLVQFSAYAQKKPAIAQPPASRIALVRAAEFYNEQSGIARLSKAQQKLMEAIRTEDSSYRKQLANLETLKQEITALERDASKQAEVAMKRPLVPQLERDVEERKFMLDEAYQLKEREFIAPVIRAIIEELDAYRRTKKFTIVLNADNLNQSGTLLSFDPAIDVTTDFIQHYNKKFPLP
jgi:hypothetical protein